MTENEAIKMLKAKLTCMKLEALSCIEKGCDKDCECCEYNYAQGNMGEQKEALDIAIQSLEEIQKYRAIGTLEECREAMERVKMQCHCKDCIHVDCAGCRGKTVYCMKHGCYMQEDDFCNHAEAEVALEKMKGEEQ